MDECYLTLTGYVSEPKQKELGGKPTVSVSIASGKSAQDPVTGEWKRLSNWYGVDLNLERYGRAIEGLEKGDYVMVRGRLEPREGRDGKLFLNIRPDAFTVLRRKNPKVEAPEEVSGNPF
jgi:hypothetical protein